jgi:3-oxoacyl-[acyl-carrier-protein] synthase II
MPASPRRAVLTGLGVISPIGSDHASFWAACRAGTSAVRRITLLDPGRLPCPIAGEVPNFDAKKLLTSKDMKKALKVMARTVQMGLCASQLAMDDGGPKPGTLDPFRFGVEFGCLMVATETDELAAAAKVATAAGDVDMVKWGREGLGQVPPLWMLKYLPNMPACHTSIYFDAQGPNNTVTEADAAGLLALGEAYRIIGRDLADFFLVGGCESKINPVSLARHNLFTPMTKRVGEPATAVRPFDATRDGTAMGEGSTVLGLEELSHAQKRGAKIYAELAGFACGFDRGLKGSVLAGVIRNALKEAGITPADVDHVNAHAAGQVELDAFEARAIREALGDVPVYALKGQTGNMGAAGSLTELAVSLLSFQHGELPGTINHHTADPACPVRVHVGQPRRVAKPWAVKVAYTDMGQCAAAVIRKWDG